MRISAANAGVKAPSALMGRPGSNWIGNIVPNIQNGIESTNTSAKKVKIDLCLLCITTLLYCALCDFPSIKHRTDSCLLAILDRSEIEIIPKNIVILWRKKFSNPGFWVEGKLSKEYSCAKNIKINAHEGKWRR